MTDVVEKPWKPKVENICSPKWNRGQKTRAGELLRRERLANPDQAVVDWVDKGTKLVQSASAHQWAIADWMLWGENHIIDLREAYDLAEKATGFSRKTLREWAYVARHVSIRMDKLTFGHHQVVAPLLPEAQKRCLEHAAAQVPVMPIGDLREMARWQPRLIDPEDTNYGVSLPVVLLQRDLKLLEVAARQQGFQSDEYASAVGQMVYQIVQEYVKANPDLFKASSDEYRVAVDAFQHPEVGVIVSERFQGPDNPVAAA